MIGTEKECFEDKFKDLLIIKKQIEGLLTRNDDYRGEVETKDRDTLLDDSLKLFYSTHYSINQITKQATIKDHETGNH